MKNSFRLTRKTVTKNLMFSICILQVKITERKNKNSHVEQMNNSNDIDHNGIKRKSN